MILISKSAFGAFRWSGGFFPYIIAFDWMMLSVYESAIDPNITPIFNNAIVKEWMEHLKTSLEEKSLGSESVSTVYKTNLVERKFIDFFSVEACLEFFICHYLNIGTVYGDTNANEELQVRSVGISNKRPIEESNKLQLKKKRKPSTIAIEEDYVIEPPLSNEPIEPPSSTEPIEPPSSNEPIEPPSSNEPVESPSSSEPTPSIRRYGLDEFLTPKEYQSQVIDTLWSSEFEIPDSAIIPKSTSILNNTPPIEEITDEITNEIPIDSSSDTEIPNSPTVNSTPVNPPPELTQSTQLSSDNEEEEEVPYVSIDATYAAAEAIIIDQINKIEATTFERRTAFANLRNIRLQRDTLEFISSQ